MPEHAVIIRLSLDDNRFGSERARREVRALQRGIRAALEGGDLGELAGDEFGGGGVVLYLYGPDADQLFVALEPLIRTCSLRPARATLRYGDVDDPTVEERHLDL